MKLSETVKNDFENMNYVKYRNLMKLRTKWKMI